MSYFILVFINKKKIKKMIQTVIKLAINTITIFLVIESESFVFFSIQTPFSKQKLANILLDVSIDSLNLEIEIT